MRLCARDTVKQYHSFLKRVGVKKKLSAVVVNWLLLPGGTRHCIARSVRHSTDEVKEMIREEDRLAWRRFWLKVIPFLVAVLVVSFACWGGK